MNISNIQLSRLITKIYAAALDAPKWQTVIDELALTSCGAHVFLFGHDREANEITGSYSSGFDPERVASFHSHYGRINPWTPVLTSLPSGVVAAADAICPRKTMEASEMYNDWMRPQEDLIGGGGVVLFNELGRHFVLGANIRRKDQEKLESGWLELLRRMSPHLIQSFEIARAIAARDATWWDMDSSPAAGSALFVLNAHGFVCWANLRGEALLSSGAVFRVDVRGRLTANDAGLNSWLQEAEKRLSQTISQVPTLIWQSRALYPRFVCRMMVREIQDRSETQRIFPDFIERHLILVANFKAPADRPEYRLSSEYGLTKREVQVALAVAGGATVRTISESNDVSIHTVRSQLKTVMSKLGVRRQADVVRFLLPLIEAAQDEDFSSKFGS